MNVLVEGIGSMVFNTQLKYYKEMNWNIIGIDIDNKSSGAYTVTKSYIVPKYSDKGCFDAIEGIIENENIDLVFPSINEGLLGWSKKRERFLSQYGTNVIISNEQTIDICTDKWKTYKFFNHNNIPTPKTSLDFKYDLIKPRVGRGSVGIFLKDDLKEDFIMSGNISQGIVKGQEYTIDVLCDFNSKPIYIIPRKRVGVESGVSVKGLTTNDKDIIKYCEKIVEALKPIGIINIQCFKDGEDIYFIEINPRIGGGSSLSFSASDNWFRAIESFVLGKEYIPKTIKYNRYMFRTYKDVIVDQRDLIRNME